MNSIPTWWLLVSALFFAVNIVFMAVMAVVGFRALETLRELKPKVEGLSAKANETMDKVQLLTTKVDSLTTSIKGTVDIVGVRARNVSNSVENLSGEATTQLSRLAPMIGTAMTILKIVQAYREYRSAKRRR